MIAHQGGWDELLVAVAPVFLLLLLVALGRRRATPARDEVDGEADRSGPGAARR